MCCHANHAKIGKSWVRVPPRVSYFPSQKISRTTLQQSKMGAVTRTCLAFHLLTFTNTISCSLNHCKLCIFEIPKRLLWVGFLTLIIHSTNRLHEISKQQDSHLEPLHQLPFGSRPNRNAVDIKILHPWWHHRMETFSALLPLCEGICRSPMDFLYTDQQRGALMFS